MATLTSLSVLLKGDSSGLVRAARTGGAALADFGRVAARAAAVTGALTLGAAGAAAGVLVSLGNAARESIDAQAKNAKQLAITVGEMQRLNMIARQAGVTTEKITESTAKLSAELGRAGQGSTSAAKKFEALGLSADELAKRSPIEALESTLQALRGISDQSEQAAKGQAIFGEAWAKIRPLMLASNTAFRDAEKLFGRLGLAISEDAAGAVESFNDRLDTMATIATGLRDKVFATLAPRLAELAQRLLNVSVAFIEANGGAAGIAELLAGKLVSALRSVAAFVDFVRPGLAALGAVLSFLFSVLRGLGTIQGGILATAGALAEGNLAGALSVVRSVPGDVRSQFESSGEDEQLEEARRQSRLLERLLEKEFGAAFQ